MFRQLANSRVSVSEPDAKTLFRTHPIVLTELLERSWEMLRNQVPGDPLGSPLRRSDLEGIPNPFLHVAPPVVPILPAGAGILLWDHLMYAYLIESTQICEIFRKVVHEFLHGERLGVPSGTAPDDTRGWLRNTEELFFRDPPHFYTTSMTSWLRPNLKNTRWNAYYRMFGMPPAEGRTGSNAVSSNGTSGDAKDWNNEFTSTWERFLREVKTGMDYFGSTTGPNPTSDVAIAESAKRLHEMLMARRQSGNLSREEFWAVATMSWFHLTVAFNSPIVADAGEQGQTEAERLANIARRATNTEVKDVSLLQSYFELADLMSILLIQIELGTYDSLATVKALYTPTPGNAARQDMELIVHHWPRIRPSWSASQVSTDGRLSLPAVAGRTV